MAQYLTLSRAARLVGVKRAALQTKISNGELPTFEGLIELNDLLHVYPDAHVDDSPMLERVDRIKMQAVPRALREASGMPDPDTVLARLTDLSEELARSRARQRGLRELVDQLGDKLQDAEHAAGEDTRAVLQSLRGWLEQAVARQEHDVPSADALTVRDTVLRLMAAHVRLFPSGHDFFVEGNDSILDAGLRAGYPLVYGCTDGSCGRCKGRLLAGRIKPIRRPSRPLSAAERDHGQILTCCNTAVTDIELEAPEITTPTAITPQFLKARVARIQRYQDVLVLRLQTLEGQRLQFLAGQYMELAAEGIPGADYSVASCPCDESYLEFHIARAPDVAFADWAFNRLTLADVITLRGPRGAFTLREDSPNPIVFVAWDAGFAPIKSLVENAMAVDLAEHMHLFWIAEGRSGHYFHNLCRSWADALDNFTYTPIAVPGHGRGDVEHALYGIVEHYAELSRCDVYMAAPAPVLEIAGPFLVARGLPRVQLRAEPLRQGGTPPGNPL